MNRNWIRITFLFTATAALYYGDVERSAATHKSRMDAAQDASDEAQDALNTKSSDRANAASAKLLAFADEESAYWKKAGDSSAVKLAEANKLAIGQLISNLKGSDWKTSEESYQKVQATCRACHDVHLSKRN